MEDKGEIRFKKQHQEMIALSNSIKEQADFLTYSVNPIGMPYEQWRLMVEVIREDINEIESLLPQLKAILASCFEV